MDKKNQKILELFFNIFKSTMKKEIHILLCVKIQDCRQREIFLELLNSLLHDVWPIKLMVAGKYVYVHLSIIGIAECRIMRLFFRSRDNLTVDTDRYESALLFRDVGKDDSGEYVLRARNEAGDSYVGVNVNVIGKIEIRGSSFYNDKFCSQGIVFMYS